MDIYLIHYDNGIRFEDNDNWISEGYFTSYEDAETFLLKEGYVYDKDWSNNVLIFPPNNAYEIPSASIEKYEPYK